jgi:hypothetical protein
MKWNSRFDQFLMLSKFSHAFLGIALWAAAVAPLPAETPYKSNSDFAKYAMKLRESALLSLEPQVLVPRQQVRPLFSTGVTYPWKQNIMTTIFWVGESATQNNPVHNRSSSWDANWSVNFGGFDDPNPAARRGFLPAAFIPKQNPFYVALPYNDVTRGTTKPEARMVIPWFKKTFVREGQSICRDRWVAIRNKQNGKICYAQWSDCGPFRTDHWQYVFGTELPKPNLNQGAGLDVSPAVRDYLGIGSKALLDWKFVEFGDIPRGPWSQHGENNTFVQQKGRASGTLVSAAPVAKEPVHEGPRVITK